MFASFWPHALDDQGKATDPHNPGRKSPAMAAMAKFLDEAQKIVFFNTLKEATWKNTRIMREANPHERK